MRNLVSLKRKIFTFSSFSFLIIIFLFISTFVSFQVNQLKFMNSTNENITMATLTKPEYMSKNDYIEILNNSSTFNYMYKDSNIIDNKLNVTYYYKNIPTNLKNIIVNDVNSTECFTNKMSSKNIINVFPIYEIDTICSVSQLSSNAINLNSSMFYFYTTDLQEISTFEQKIKKEGILLELNPEFIHFQSNPNLIIATTILFFLIILTILSIFKIVNDTKSYGIFKMNGCSNFKYFLKLLFSEICVILLINIVFDILLYLYLYEHNISSSFYLNIKLIYEYEILLFILYYGCTYVYFYFYSKNMTVSNALNGIKKFTFVKLTLTAFKILFAIFFIISSSLIINFIAKNIDAKKATYKYEEISEYYTISKNGGSASGEDESYVSRYSDFYTKYDSVLSGILIFSNNFYSSDIECDSNYNSDCFVVANEKYFEFNKIYNNLGEEVFPNSSDDKINVFIPETYKNHTNEIIEFFPYTNDENLDKKFFDVTYLEPNQEFFSYNAKGSNTESQFMKDPIIFMYNDELMSDFFNIFAGNSTGNYFVTGSQDNIVNALEKTGLKDDYVKEIFLKKDGNDYIISQTITYIIITSIFLAICTLMYFTLIIFETYIKFKSQEKELIIGKVNGISFFINTKKIMHGVLITNAILCIITILLNKNIYIILFIATVDIIFTILYLRTLIRKNILDILKGDK